MNRICPHCSGSVLLSSDGHCPICGVLAETEAEFESGHSLVESDDGSNAVQFSHNDPVDDLNEVSNTQPPRGDEVDRAKVIPRGIMGSLGYCMLLNLALLLGGVFALFLVPSSCVGRYYRFENISEHAVKFIVATDIVMFLVGLWLLRGQANRPIKRIIALRCPSAIHVLLVLLLLPALLVIEAGLSAWATQALAENPAVSISVANLFPGNSILERAEAMFEALAQKPWGVLFLVGCVGPAIAEEIFFRAFLGRGLVARHGVAIGVFVTSLIFGAYHIWPSQASFTFLFGIGIHLIFLATKSIWIPMMVHALNNLIAFGLMKASLGRSLQHCGCEWRNCHS